VCPAGGADCALATAPVDRSRISDVETDRRIWIPEIARRMMILEKMPNRTVGHGGLAS